MCKTFIHVNQAVIKKNKKTGSRDPVITCKTYKSNDYGHEAIIYDNAGNEIARVVYRPEKPLSCGAQVWVETTNRVEVRIRNADSNNEGSCSEGHCGMHGP